MPHRPVLVVGSYREETSQRVREAATAAGVTAEFFSRPRTPWRP